MIAAVIHTASQRSVNSLFQASDPTSALMANADPHHDDHGHECDRDRDRDHASRKTHYSAPLDEDAAWNNLRIGLKSHFENNTEFNLMTKDGILIVQGYRNQKRKIRHA